jgi:hypothetical protein
MRSVLEKLGLDIIKDRRHYLSSYTQLGFRSTRFETTRRER